MICDFVNKSKGAIAKQSPAIVVNSLQQKINQISIDDVIDTNIMDTVLRKNNFNSSIVKIDDVTELDFNSIIKRPELPVICQQANNLNDENSIEPSLPGNEVNMRKDSQVSSGSKIPVFNPSLRISKCSSWACGDITPSPEITDLTPGNFWLKFFFFLMSRPF